MGAFFSRLISGVSERLHPPKKRVRRAVIVATILAFLHPLKVIKGIVMPPMKRHGLYRAILMEHDVIASDELHLHRLPCGKIHYSRTTLTAALLNIKMTTTKSNRQFSPAIYA
jgi:hypothetical protein